MKKILLIGLCAILLIMPALSALPVEETKTSPIIQNEKSSRLETPMMPEYDGTFIGGIGLMYRENETWMFDTHGYLAGVYKQGRRMNRVVGNIYNLDEEQIGTLKAFFGHKLILGSIENMDGQRAPIIGFLLYNEDNFAGRIMSVAGPAPHIWGEYTPN